ncbi:hypothetical protein [Chromobacterium violaceum]|uniref:hypothetical protein n=1 Tax=Chromobacterium violaceum TaxID=536 RepID=UPI00143DD86E|nr:hypothetical protein [Chromobacterium violaceum]QIY81475.1 hypothetical protein FOB43_20905 [Chromobacterium violaceum]
MEHTKQAAVAWAVTGTQHDGRRYLELREDEKTAQVLTDGIRRWHPGCDVDMRPLVYGDVPKPAPAVPAGFSLEDCRSLPKPEIRVHKHTESLCSWRAVQPADGVVYKLLCAMIDAGAQPYKDGAA